jgi:hypothetical protein
MSAALKCARLLSSRAKRSNFIAKLNKRLAPQNMMLRATRGWGREFQFILCEITSDNLIKRLVDVRDVARLAAEFGVL